MAKVQVLLFAQLKEQMGVGTLEQEISTDACASDLSSAMGLKGPILYAVNQNQVDSNCRLQDGDVVALMPPMSGG